MKTITISETGFYDTSHEYKTMLLHAGEVLPVAERQLDAPCKGKRGKGVWCESEGGLVFVDSAD